MVLNIEIDEEKISEYVCKLAEREFNALVSSGLIERIVSNAVKRRVENSASMITARMMEENDDRIEKAVLSGVTEFLKTVFVGECANGRYLAYLKKLIDASFKENMDVFAERAVEIAARKIVNRAVKKKASEIESLITTTLSE